MKIELGLTFLINQKSFFIKSCTFEGGLSDYHKVIRKAMCEENSKAISSIKIISPLTKTKLM